MKTDSNKEAGRRSLALAWAALNCASNGKSLWEPNEFVAFDCIDGISFRQVIFRVEAKHVVNTFIGKMVRGSV